MVQSIAHLVPHSWIRFCQNLRWQNIIIPDAEPALVARCFREEFDLPCPLHFSDVMNFLGQFDELEVRTVPQLEQDAEVRGQWDTFGGRLIIRINGSRPKPSRVKSVFHEIYEILCAVSYQLFQDLRQPNPNDKVYLRRREANANRFAAHIKMPPEIFQSVADECGMDLRILIDEFDETVAGVARQLRDYNARYIPFYVARCHVERYCERKCPTLIPVREESGGIIVRIEDVIRTPMVSRKALGVQYGALPLYNVPSQQQWRVMPREVLRAINNKTPIYIPVVGGTNSYEHRVRDLMGEYDFSVLIVPFSTRQEVGVTIIGVQPFHVSMLLKQINQPKTIQRDDIDWIFSQAAETARRPKRIPIETDLSLKDPKAMSVPLVLSTWSDDGEELYSFDQIEYSWRRFAPLRQNPKYASAF